MTIRYVGDLEPDVEIILTGDAPVDLTPATMVVVQGSRDDWATLTIDRQPSSYATEGDNTRVNLPLIADDTATEGRTELRVVVTWPGDRQQTYPGAVLDVRKDSDGIRL